MVVRGAVRAQQATEEEMESQQVVQVLHLFIFCFSSWFENRS